MTLARRCLKPSCAPTKGRALAVVQNIGSPCSPSDDPPMLKGALADQLQKVAESHGGRVPLHGRLFAQWMHYAFLREYPFHHKAGAFAQHRLLESLEEAISHPKMRCMNIQKAMMKIG